MAHLAVPVQQVNALQAKLSTRNPIDCREAPADQSTPQRQDSSSGSRSAATLTPISLGQSVQEVTAALGQPKNLFDLGCLAA